MGKNIFEYLEKNYRYLNNFVKEMDENLFKSPHTSIMKGRIFVENLTKEIAKLEGYGLMVNLTQVERLMKLEADGVLTENIDKAFNTVRRIGNQAAHSSIEGELEAALRVHRNVYEITSWFIALYLDPNFEAEKYANPMPSQESSAVLDKESIIEIIKTTLGNMDNKTEGIPDNNKEANLDSDRAKEIEEAHTDLAIESIFDGQPDKKCIIQQLSKLKESSKEAVENLGEFSPFKNYMHIVRDTQKSLEDLIIKSHKSDKAELILVCGSVGDGKSHVISYCKNKYKDIMQGFHLHNDATESLEPNKTSMDTLNEVLDEFSDEKIETSKKKLILAINLGTLTNFIDSQYGERFKKLREFVEEKKILENSIEDSEFDENSSFQYVNFSDYHLFTLKNGKVSSEYIKSMIQRITRSHENAGIENNIFYESYAKNCSKCENSECCPIKANFELLSQDNVQDSIVDLLVQCVVKNKIIISTRALLNFMYELIVPRAYVDVNSPTFKSEIRKLNNKDYIKSLMPNIIFNHKELSFIFESLNTIDPLNIRNEEVDDFIIDFNNSSNIMEYFKDNIDFPRNYLTKVKDIDFNETQDKNIRYELLRLFIRSYYMCSKGELFSLRDEDYNDYMNALFYWNRGDKLKLKKVYNNVKEGIINWNGDAEKDHINIFLGKNQLKYKVSERIDIKADLTNLPNNDEDDLKKFIGTLKLKYKANNSNQSYEIDVDYKLYKLLVQVNKGYRPNKKDKNYFINFIEFINKVVETGSQNEEIIFMEKNREENKKFKLEFDEEFETYRFVEI